MDHGTTTLWRWEQDGSGGDHGTLTLWPGTPGEMRLVVADFATAKTLYGHIERRIDAAYVRGRESMHRDILRITP